MRKWTAYNSVIDGEYKAYMAFGGLGEELSCAVEALQIRICLLGLVPDSFNEHKSPIHILLLTIGRSESLPHMLFDRQKLAFGPTCVKRYQFTL